MIDIYTVRKFCEKASDFHWFCTKNVGFCPFLFILAIAIFHIFVIIEEIKVLILGHFFSKNNKKTYKTNGGEKVYTAMNVASEIVRQYEQKHKTITNLKLQKVLYYSQMRSLQQCGNALFDDDFQAWRHGPVIPEVYEVFRKYVSRDIDYDDIDVIKNRTDIAAEQKRVIAGIVDVTLNLQAWDLVDKTHQTKPWKDTYIPNMNRIITKDRIRRDGEVNLS